jgi:glycine cleavage system pyridoxal-binding protein P
MLDFLGCKTMDEFMGKVVPNEIRLKPEEMFRHNGRHLEGIDSETLMLERVR